ncbi:putative ER membrane protein complex subunit [Arabidopsis thaliana]|uniref:Uncharacterized protein family (UPF0172) n=1 Tax=Arabidopsis thaliana TaxID=3702 RepID=F4KDB4_ARATH|nr:Uncharacterized protein family (UPF0172) [Arabidopsis thaliana]AED96104.2 Uncharacterized protein family (UPF0172) [Arabidopsis thaliana]|eukprot:NP_001318779.1 Uncharacterized protein family (UPF0172) [Arabidopsis thaliana]
MIEEHYVAQGLSIVGYFHANERFDDVELCGVAKNIGSKRLRVSSVPSKLKINAKVAKKLKERQWCDYLWFASMSDSNLLSI